MRAFVLGALALGSLGLPASALTSDLSGSPASMVHQHAIAVDEDYSFLRTPADVRALEEKGALVAVKSGEHFTLSNVSFASTRPEVLSFIEHFAERYHEATGTRLVVTSLTRPTALQPSNAHKLSVHPAGMAVDLRVPGDATSRAWLEKELLALEHDGVIDVTRERTPAHYHVAVFAEPWLAYAARLDSARAVQVAQAQAAHRASVARALAYRLPADEPTGAPKSLLFAGLLATIPITRRVRRRASQ